MKPSKEDPTQIKTSMNPRNVFIINIIHFHESLVVGNLILSVCLGSYLLKASISY